MYIYIYIYIYIYVYILYFIIVVLYPNHRTDQGVYILSSGCSVKFIDHYFDISGNDMFICLQFDSGNS